MRIGANQDYITALALATGSIDTLFESALPNAIGVTEFIAPGTKLEIVLPNLKLNALPKPLPVMLPVRRIAVIENQNIQDLTIQTAGSFEHLFEFALLNQLSVSELIYPGQEFKNAGVRDAEIVAYYASKGVKPATDINREIDPHYAVFEYVVENYWI